MRAESGVLLRQVHADGGATANAFLMQFVADLTGVELRVAANPHFSPLGAAMMGFLGLGLVPALSAFAGFASEEASYLPAMPRDRVAANYAGWQKALDQVLNVAPAGSRTGAGENNKLAV
jgi:glycerol kinase